MSSAGALAPVAFENCTESRVDWNSYVARIVSDVSITLRRRRVIRSRVCGRLCFGSHAGPASRGYLSDFHFRVIFQASGETDGVSQAR